jgi:hypothetical protein
MSFCGCAALRSICIPASVEMIHGSALPDVHSIITVEEGNRHLRVAGDFLVDIEGITVIRYLGSGSDIALNREIEIIGAECFSHCSWILSFKLESGSRLRRIEDGAFLACEALESICIPASVEVLCAHCLAGCSLLSSVGFEVGRFCSRGTKVRDEDRRISRRHSLGSRREYN